MKIAECVLCTGEFETDDEGAVVCDPCVEDDPKAASQAVLQARADAQRQALPVPLWIDDGRLFDVDRLRDREMRLSQDD